MAADMIGKVPPPAAVAALIERVTAGTAEAAELLAVIRALVRAGLLDDDAYGEQREPLVAVLAGLIGDGAAEGVRDDALVALADVDAAKATTACYTLFARSPVPDGPAGRWLERLTGVVDPPVEALVAELPRVDNLRSVLTSRALAERGAVALPALHSALAALPVQAIGPVPHADATLGSTGGEDDGDRDRGGGAYGPREQPRQDLLP